MTKSSEQIERERQRTTSEIERVKHDLALLDAGRERLDAEHSALSAGVPSLTVIAFNGGGPSALSQLRDVNCRLREIESERGNIEQARAELEIELRSLDVIGEAERVAALQVQASQLENDEDQFCAKFKQVIDLAAQILTQIANVHDKRAEVLRAMDGSTIRWREVARDLENYTAWRLGRRRGGRKFLEIGQVSVNSGWISQQTASNEQRLALANANDNGHTSEE